jgi:antitoxin VapB
VIRHHTRRNTALAALAPQPATNKTVAVAHALRIELQRVAEATPFRARLRPTRDRVLSRPATGQQADKAFFDELSGDL